jgi:hypothetical protein
MKEGLFNYVISFFATWAWQTLGKVPSPITGKAEKKLEEAKQAIDILETLREKTKGNLDNTEEKLLTSTIAELQMNYIDEMNKNSAEAKEEKSENKEREQKKEIEEEKKDSKEN